MTTSPHSTRLLSVRARLGTLNEDELEAFDVMLAKLEQGKRDHGPLDLASDPRDFPAEGREELRDWLWYHAFHEVKQRQVKPVDPPSTDPIVQGLRELRDAATYERPSPFEGEAP